MDVANLELPDPDTIMCLKEGERTELDYLKWLDVRQCSTSHFYHKLRYCLKQEQWCCLAQRRPSFQGIQNGIDRLATLELPKMLGGLPKYRLRCILSGALATRSRLHRNDSEVLPTCQLCGSGAVETTEHLLLSCPSLQGPRSTEMDPEFWETPSLCQTSWPGSK